MRPMALKLFRSTGYSSILVAGETRLALHPAWMILGVSLWVGFVCNVAVWRGLRGSASLAHGLVVAGAVTAASVLWLSVFGWRKTLKPAATLLLVLAALASSSIWSQAWPVDASLLERPPSTVFVPPWASLLRWQVSATLAGLALVPAVWVSQTAVRRLGGPQQLRVNLLGIGLAVAALAGTAWLLRHGA
jgi:glucan phosphoethanolaminetransferase (alkaline phosphatase superfamily)